MSVIASGFANKQKAARGYDGARTGRLFSDWIAAATSSDAEIRNSFRRLVNRSRDLERNNDYQRGFLLACERNVIGAVKYDLRMDAGEKKFPGGGKAPVFESDPAANSQIEDAWFEWGKKGTCTVDGRHSWRDFRRLAVRTVPRDGNFIARKVRGKNARNRFGFALQIWEIDHLDLLRFEVLRNGNQIKFGIETDPDDRVVAYWLQARHPGDFYASDYTLERSTRFEASEIYHVALPDRAEQSIGIPWIVSSITRLRQLGMFEEAAVVAARLGASKTGFFKKIPGANGELGTWTGEKNAQGQGVMDAEPDNWNPEYPNTTTGDFRKAMLRGTATGLGMSYNTLGNDMESVNFSSGRLGLFEEREGWKGLQLFFNENLFELVFQDFLEAAILSSAVRLPLGKFAKFNRPIFKSRRWPFIDPAKEIAAAASAVALRVSSRRQIIEEQGGDVEDVFKDNADDEKLAADLKLTLAPPLIASTSATSGAAAGQLAEEDGTPAPAAKS